MRLELGHRRGSDFVRRGRHEQVDLKKGIAGLLEGGARLALVQLRNLGERNA